MSATRSSLRIWGIVVGTAACAIVVIVLVILCGGDGATTGTGGSSVTNAVAPLRNGGANDLRGNVANNSASGDNAPADNASANGALVPTFSATEIRRYRRAIAVPDSAIATFPVALRAALEQIARLRELREAAPELYLAALLDLAMRLRGYGHAWAGQIGRNVSLAAQDHTPEAITVAAGVDGVVELAVRGERLRLLAYREGEGDDDKSYALELSLPLADLAAISKGAEPLVPAEVARFPDGSWSFDPAGAGLYAPVAFETQGKSVDAVPMTGGAPNQKPWPLVPPETLHRLKYDADVHALELQSLRLDPTGQHALGAIRVVNRSRYVRGMPMSVPLGRAVLWYDRRARLALPLPDMIEPAGPPPLDRTTGWYLSRLPPPWVPLALSADGQHAVMLRVRDGELAVYRRQGASITRAWTIAASDGDVERAELGFRRGRPGADWRSVHPAAVFSEDGARLIVSSGYKLSVWDTLTKRRLVAWDVPPCVWFLAVGDGRFLGVAAGEKEPVESDKVSVPGVDVLVDLRGATPKLRVLGTRLGEIASPSTTAVLPGATPSILYIDWTAERDRALKRLPLGR